MAMVRRFVFVREVEELVAKGQNEMELPEGTRFSAAAADLIKERGIRITFTSGPASDSGKAPESEENPNESKGTDVNSVRGTKEQQSLIAVVSAGRAITDPVGNVAARSPYFLIFDGQGKLIEALENLRLKVHRNRAQMWPVNKGTDWLGYRVYPTHRLVRRSNVRRFRTKLKLVWPR